MILATVNLIALAFEISLCFKKNISDTLSVSCMIMTGCAYLFALFGIIRYSFILIFLIILSLGIYLFLTRARHEYLSEIRENIFNPALLVITISLACLYIITNSTYVFQWDEFSHWATTVKEMYYTGELSIQENSITNFRSYPPAMACWQYLFVLTGEKWADWEIVYAYDVFLVAFMMPMCRKLKGRSILFVVPALLAMYLMPFIYESPGEGTPWHCIYIDRAISIVFAYSLFMYFSAKLKPGDVIDAFSFCSSVASLCVLSLLKSIGLAFAFFVIAMMAADTLLCKKDVKKLLIRLLIASAVVFLLNRTWTLKLLLNDVSKNWSTSAIGMEQIFKLLSGNEEQYRYELALKFCQCLVYNGIQHNTGVIKIGMIGFPAIWFAILYFLFNHNGNGKARSIVVPVILIIGFVIYEFCVLMLELYILPQEEALPSTTRYSADFIFGATAFVIMLLFHCLLCVCERKTFINCAILTVFLALTIYPKEIIYCLFNSDGFMHTAYVTTGYDRYLGIEESIGETLTGDDMVYILTADDDFGYYALRKIMLPAWTANAREQVAVDTATDNWPDYIIENGFNYVFVNKSNEEFDEKYEALFEGNNVQELTLYKVSTDGEELRLLEVELG